MTLAMPLTCPYSGSGSQAGAVPMAGPGSLVPCCRAMRRRRLLPRPITAWTAAGLAADIRREQAALLPARGLIPEHAPVHREQRGLLLVVEPGIGTDHRLPRARAATAVLAGLASGMLQQAGLGEQAFRGHVERVGQQPQHPHRRLVQAALDLAQVRVGEAGQLGELTERQVGQLALAPDEAAQGLHLGVPWVYHRHLTSRRGPRANNTEHASARRP